MTFGGKEIKLDKFKSYLYNEYPNFITFRLKALTNACRNEYSSLSAVLSLCARKYSTCMFI